MTSRIHLLASPLGGYRAATLSAASETPRPTGDSVTRDVAIPTPASERETRSAHGARPFQDDGHVVVGGNGKGVKLPKRPETPMRVITATLPTDRVETRPMLNRPSRAPLAAKTSRDPLEKAFWRLKLWGSFFAGGCLSAYIALSGIGQEPNKDGYSKTGSTIIVQHHNKQDKPHKRVSKKSFKQTKPLAAAPLLSQEPVLVTR